MTNAADEPERIDDDLQPADDEAGTGEGDPTAGVVLDESEAQDVVEPDDNSLEVDGPTQKHA